MHIHNRSEAGEYMQTIEIHFQKNLLKIYWNLTFYLMSFPKHNSKYSKYSKIEQER